MERALPKVRLLKEVKRFLKDPKRGISIDLFAELCGISTVHLRDVFIDESEPMTEMVQIRVHRGFKKWQNGEVKVMQNRDKSRFVDFRKEPEPKFVRSTGLHLVDGQIKLKIGVKNRADYSQPSLDEQLGGKHG